MKNILLVIGKKNQVIGTFLFGEQCIYVFEVKVDSNWKRGCYNIIADLVQEEGIKDRVFRGRVFPASKTMRNRLRSAHSIVQDRGVMILKLAPALVVV